MLLRDAARQLDEDFDVLPGGVEDLGDLLVGQQLEERREVDARRSGSTRTASSGVATWIRQSFGQ